MCGPCYSSLKRDVELNYQSQAATAGHGAQDDKNDVRRWPTGPPTIRSEKTGNPAGCNRMYGNQHNEMVWTRGQVRRFPPNQDGE